MCAWNLSGCVTRRSGNESQKAWGMKGPVKPRDMKGNEVVNHPRNLGDIEARFNLAESEALLSVPL